jgi:hypothetical protein
MSAPSFIGHFWWMFAVACCLQTACGINEFQGVKCYSPNPAAVVDAGPDAAGPDGGTSLDPQSSCLARGAASPLLADPIVQTINVDEGPALEPDRDGGLLCCYLVTVTEGVVPFSYGP